MAAAGIFPTLQSCTQLTQLEHPPRPDSGRNVQVFDVKFYPWATVDDEQIVALVAITDVIVLRPRLGVQPPFEILRWFRDGQEKPAASYNCIEWTKDPITRNPLLLVAGSVPKHIKIFDIASGEVSRILAGHGKGINDLAVSPLSTDIVASCSEDNTIRLWNIHPRYETQPCVAIFGGEGHRSPILAINFHSDGKWLLSGGIDTAVCMWAMPDLNDLNPPTSPTANKMYEPLMVYYPHFFSKEVHFNYVDNIVFYGDLIISRASRDQKILPDEEAGQGDSPAATIHRQTTRSKEKPNQILIWRIDGFDSRAQNLPIPDAPIPEAGRYTRSAFPHDPTMRGFERLLTLNMPFTDRFYLRFGLLQNPGMRPILAMGNEMSRICFWDLWKLTDGIDPREEARKAATTAARRGARAKASNVAGSIGRSAAAVDPGLFEHHTAPQRLQHQTLLSNLNNSATPPRRIYPDDRFTPLNPHYTKMINHTHTRIRNTMSTSDEESSSSSASSSPPRRSRGPTTSVHTSSTSSSDEKVTSRRRKDPKPAGNPKKSSAAAAPPPPAPATQNRQKGERFYFATAQVAWSPDGTWMVTGGDWGVLCIFHRDRSKVGLPKDREEDGATDGGAGEHEGERSTSVDSRGTGVGSGVGREKGRGRRYG